MNPELAALLASLGLGRTDAAETIFAPRQLLDLETEVQRTPREPMMGDILVPLDTSVNPGATHWGYRRMDAVGIARPIGTKAGDMPYVELQEFETQVPMHQHGLGIQYSIDEARAARMANKPVDAERGVACRDGHDAARDRITMLGMPSLGIPGFINATGVAAGNVTNGGWASATADDMVEDVCDEIQEVKDQSRGVYVPLTVALPPFAWNRITSVRIPNTSTTVLEYLKKIRPGLEFFESYHLTTAGAGNTGRMVTYLRDRKVLVQKTSILFELLPPQYVDQLVKIPGLSKHGGTHVKIPLAMKYGDNL